MNESRFELVRRCRDGEASTEEFAQFETFLKEDTDFREAYVRYVNLDVALHSAVNARLTPAKTTVVSRPRRHVWRRWHPLSAMAAGLVIGLFSATMIFAFGMPKMAQWMLELSNAGFEELVAPLPDGIPVRYGVWSGDYADVVVEQSDIVPHEGKRMFRFLRSDSMDPLSGNTVYNGNIYQLIDMRAWREAIAGGTAAVDWSAWFNWAPDASEVKPKFAASVWAFAGDTSFVRKNWQEKLHQELAYSSWTILADSDPKSWQPIAGCMIVPPDTDFLVIELKTLPENRMPVNGVVNFAGHYADDVKLILRTKALQKPIHFDTR